LYKVNIFVDDVRNCPQHPSWFLARSAEGALDLMRAFQSRVGVLSLDHDLGDRGIPEKHGKWLVNQLVAEGLFADTIYLHSANSEGRRNMYLYLTQAKQVGVIPPSVRIINGPHPSFNLTTGELLFE